MLDFSVDPKKSGEFLSWLSGNKPVLSLLWNGFDPRTRNFCMTWVQHKKERERKKERKRERERERQKDRKKERKKLSTVPILKEFTV